jgi:hypothetical protein
LIGRRRPDTFYGDLPDDIRPGNYWKQLWSSGAPRTVSNPTNLTGECWSVVPPVGGVEDWMLGNLELHTVREHEDGAISVRPGDGSSNSILITGRYSGGERRWHGFIEHGVWQPLPDCTP